jgi:hypothetical protein
MTKDTKVLKNIIDPIYWKVLHDTISKGYNAKQALWSISPDQIKCKTWLVKELLNIPFEKPVVQLYGGWFGFPLIDFLERHFKLSKVENIDIDPIAIYAFKMFRKYKKLSRSKYIKNANSIIDYTELDKETDLVINTSCEHMPDLPILIKNKKYKKTCVFALQSNNMYHLEEHTNCCDSEYHLAEKSELRHVLYKGKKLMGNGFERYMVIGVNA